MHPRARGSTHAATAVVAIALFAACDDSPMEVGTTALVEVTPAAEAAGVPVDAPIEVRFDAPVAMGSGHPIALQVGDCPGPVVAGAWARTADGLGLRFTPAQPLDPSTRYTIHVGGGLTDERGAIVDLDRHRSTLGGIWVTQDMVMGMGMGMGGMGMGVSHSGPEWMYVNGMYGLAFGFTTAP